MPLVPPHIQNLSAYKSGKPIDEVKREYGLTRIVKLASNENPLGVSDKVRHAVKNCMSESHRYPDTSGFELRSLLAEIFRLKMGNVVLGAGSEGIMSTIMRTFLSYLDEIIAAKNSFIGFKVLANASGIFTNWIPMKNYRYDLPSMAGAVNENTKIIYLANPDNPTGTYFTIKEFDEFMEYIPQRVLVILDEAYFEYAQNIPDYPDSMHYRYDNVITLRTFSKVYGLAGLRAGYGFAHEDLIANLQKVKLPFEPSVPAQSAAIAALKDTAYLNQSIELNKKGKKILTKHLVDKGIRTIPSAANFLTLVFEDSMIADNITLDLLKLGVIVRNLSSFGWPNCIRITIGTIEELEFFIECFDKIYNDIIIGV